MSLNINHLNEELALVIPRTDARFRTDLRAYENGDIELASKEKTWLENEQRNRRK